MNRDVEQINTTLREQRLDWMADEVEMTIARGKRITKDTPQPKGGASRLNETMVVPLSDEEQEEVLIRILRNYLVQLEDTWNSAQQTFAEELDTRGRAAVTLSVTEPANERPIPLFATDSGAPRHKLDQLLRRAWPGGADDYQKRVIQRAD